MKNSYLTPRSGAPTPVRLEGHVTLGSAEDCRIRVPGAEPQHAMISVTPEGHCVRDLTGRGLVYVNGGACSNHVLREGDVLRIGAEEFTFAEAVGDATPRVPVPAAVPLPQPQLSRPEPPPLRRSTGDTSRVVRRTTKSIPKVHKPLTVRREKSMLPLGLAAVVLAFFGLVFLGVALSKRQAALRDRTAAEAEASPAPETRLPASGTAVEFPRPAAARPALPLSPVPGGMTPAPVVPLPAAPKAEDAPPATPAAPAAEAAPAAPPAPPPPGGFVPFLRDPAARAVTANRGPVAESIRGSAGNSDVLHFLAYYLSRPESAWRITPPMTEVWNAYLKECPLDKVTALSADEHTAQARKMLEKGEGHTLSRMIALAHFLEAGRDNASVEALMTQSGFRKGPDGKYWGDPDQILQYRISRYFNASEMDDSMLELAAVSSPVFGTRYAGTLVEVRRALARGIGLEGAFQAVHECSAAGGPKGATEHLRALAASIRALGYCKDCKAGRIACTQCQGKGTIDTNCPVCKGEGRVRPSGAVGNTNLTTKCRNCDGRKTLKGVGCPACAGRLSVVCPTCKGKPWKEKTCTATGCSGGRVACSSCQGQGKERVDCPFCDGGRVRAPGAVGNADVTQKCRNCEINGQHGTGYLIKDCKTCKGGGRVNCQGCGGMFGKKGGGGEAIAVSGIYSTDSCGACGGAGWVHPKMALPCLKCAGLGVMVKPAADAAKTLE